MSISFNFLVTLFAFLTVFFDGVDSILDNLLFFPLFTGDFEVILLWEIFAFVFDIILGLLGVDDVWDVWIDSDKANSGSFSCSESSSLKFLLSSCSSSSSLSLSPSFLSSTFSDSLEVFENDS